MRLAVDGSGRGRRRRGRAARPADRARSSSRTRSCTRRRGRPCGCAPGADGRALLEVEDEGAGIAARPAGAGLRALLPPRRHARFGQRARPRDRAGAGGADGRGARARLPARAGRSSALALPAGAGTAPEPFSREKAISAADVATVRRPCACRPSQLWTRLPPSAGPSSPSGSAGRRLGRVATHDHDRPLVPRPPAAATATAGGGRPVGQAAHRQRVRPGQRSTRAGRRAS